MPSIGQSPDFKADLFSIVPSLLVLGPPAFLLFFTSTIHLFDTPLLLLLTATLLALLLPPHLPFAALLLRGRETKKCQKFSTKKKNHNFQQSNQSHLQKCSRKEKKKPQNILPPPAASSAPSVAQCVSASRPVAAACTPPAPGAAAPGEAAGDGAPLIAPCSPAASGWSRGAGLTHLAHWQWSWMAGGNGTGPLD